MKKIIISFLLMTLPSLWARDLTLEVGETRELPLSGNRIWIEKGSILKAQVQNGRVLITGHSSGESQIRIGSQVSLVQVVEHEKIILYEHLKSELKKRPGLEVKLNQGQVEILGYMHSWETWKSLLQKKFEAPYLMRARLSQSLQDNLQKWIDQDLSSQGLLSINLNREPHYHVRLHPEQQGLDLYKNYFHRLGIPILILKESLTMEPSVRVHITVAEISKSLSRTLGIEWPGSAKFDILPSGLVNAENLQATLSALESRGEAKLLASPNLICRSGKEAEFLAGGEFPIRVKSYRTQDVYWKKYGVLLKIKPFADSSGKMSLSLETEVSSLGEPVDGIPTIKSNKVSSHFDLSHSQVIALSGLLREQNSEGAKGLPWLTQVPVLGPLFSSQDYLSQKTELVIFVRPSLINQHDSGSDGKAAHLGSR